MEVIVGPPRAEGDEGRFEVLSPEISFVLYAGMFLTCRAFLFYLTVLIIAQRIRN